MKNDKDLKTYEVKLITYGNEEEPIRKLEVVKVLKKLFGIGLKECKDIADNVPIIIKDFVPIAEAQDIKNKLEEASGKVTITEN